MTIDRAQCEALDRDDPLRPCRDRFLLPPGVLYPGYFDAVAAVEQVITSRAFEAPEFQRRHTVT